MQGEEPEVRCDYGKKCGLGKKKKERRIITVSWSHIRDVSQVKSDLGEKKNPPSLRTQLSKCTKKRKCTNLSKGSPDVFLKT